jgi:hypothetical protein
MNLHIVEQVGLIITLTALIAGRFSGENELANLRKEVFRQAEDSDLYQLLKEKEIELVLRLKLGVHGGKNLQRQLLEILSVLPCEYSLGDLVVAYPFFKIKEGKISTKMVSVDKLGLVICLFCGCISTLILLRVVLLPVGGWPVAIWLMLLGPLGFWSIWDCFEPTRSFILAWKIVKNLPKGFRVSAQQTISNIGSPVKENLRISR